MQQILFFISKNSYRILFLLLLGISVSLTIQSHSYHKSKFISSANFVSGAVYEQINTVEEYINLKSQNEALAQENAWLKVLLYNKKDTTFVELSDSIKGVRIVDLTISKVIKNEYSKQENYLTINSGSAQGIKTDMGVINSLGILGVIDDTSENYATVVSILNRKSLINAKVKKSNHFGSLSWNGKSTGFVQLTDIPRLASVQKGDTIVTGADSRIFPENINIGTVEKIYIDNQTNNYTLDIRLFNDMTDLGHVYVIKNKRKEEIINLENKVKNEQ